MGRGFLCSQRPGLEQLNRVPSTHYLEIKPLSAPAARINLSGQTQSIYLAAKVSVAPAMLYPIDPSWSIFNVSAIVYKSGCNCYS